MTSVEDLIQAAVEFLVADLDLSAEPAASAAAQQSLDGGCACWSLGKPKRGKSTLVNAMLGRPVLPAGVTPLTGLSSRQGPISICLDWGLRAHCGLGDEARR